MSIVIALAVFAVFHSWLAGSSLKTTIRGWMGERAYHGLYRISYNLFAFVTFAPVAVLAMTQPGATIWKAEGWLAWAMMGVQAIGLFGLTVATLQTNGGDFMGTDQLRAYLTGAPLPLPSGTLRTDGLYGWVRHPLYFFSFLVMWFMPTMTMGLLLMVAAMTAYFLIGSRLEERRLQAAFGQAYVEYQQRVPWIVPIRMRS